MKISIATPAEVAQLVIDWHLIEVKTAASVRVADGRWRSPQTIARDNPRNDPARAVPHTDFHASALRCAVKTRLRAAGPHGTIG